MAIAKSGLFSWDGCATRVERLGIRIRDMIVSVTQIPLLLDNVMRITPSDQPSNSELTYRTGRWMAVAVRPRTYAARLPRSDVPILVTISASAAPTPRTALSTSASFRSPPCVEALMRGAEGERLGNDMHSQFVEHDLQRKLG